MRIFRYPFQAAISKGGNADYNYYCLQRSDTKEYWDMFDETPSAEFKSIVEVMLQEEPNARLTMADVVGHQWMVLPTATAEQFKEKYKDIIGNVANYPEYSVDFDRADAKNSLCRGTSLFCEETDPP